MLAFNVADVIVPVAHEKFVTVAVVAASSFPEAAALMEHERELFVNPN